MALRVLTILVFFSLLLPSSAACQIGGPDLDDPGRPQVWVAPGLPQAAPGQDQGLVLSAFSGRLLLTELSVSVLDDRGRVVASSSWRLEGGIPAELRLDPLLPVGAKGLHLLVWGLDAGPGSLVLSLRQERAGGGSLPVSGQWLQVDPALLPAEASNLSPGGS